MRKMMLVASLVSTMACGSVQEPGAMSDDTGSDGSGSDVGSGSGSADAGVPEQTGCMKAADCGANMACDLATHACVAGALTVDSSDFVVDNGVWWTTTNAPTLHGTFDGPSNARVDVKVGGSTIPTTLTGNTWAVALPGSSITTSSVPIVVMLTDPSGSDIELSRTLGLDTAPPSITVQASTVRDERGDSIDFSTGEPIHTHAGATIDLGAAGCPSVYKYAYLMDASPAFGSSTSPNDLAWKLRVTDAKLQAGSQQFRVRTDTGTVLVAWTALPAPDAAGYSTVKLTRNGGSFPIASLGTRTGQFFIDVRATDWAGLTTNSSVCFDHHPLAAPLVVSAFEKGDLFSITTTTDASIAHLLESAASVSVVKQHIVQQVAESVTISWSVDTAMPAYTAKKMWGYVEETSPAAYLCAPGNTNPTCVMTTKPAGSPAATETMTSGTLVGSFAVTLRDDVSGQIVASSTTRSISWTIPARTANEGPHAYTIEIDESGFYALQPEIPWWSAPTIAVNTLLGLAYTGTAPSDIQGQQCVKMVQSAFGPMCQTAIRYWGLSALDQATLSYQPFVATLTAGASAAQQVAPSYLPANVLTSEAFTWDSGDDDLPGAL